ncbi:MAG: prepilin-type N-terminal cleavage/methylation domain-containing protein [Terriglobales bacterium]
MGDRSTKRERGFSLLEMTIAMALGTLVMGAAVQLYSKGVAATWTVSQRAELQQDFRAASNILTRDLSLAGAGLTQGAAIELATSATIPVYGCDQTGACYLGSANNAAATFPKQGSAPYLYGLIPGYQAGPTMTSNPNATDTVTVVYTDSTFLLNCYKATVTSATVVTFSLPSPLTCTLPSGVTTPQALNDAVVGLTAGDLILFSTTPQVVAEVTGTPTATGATTFTVPFAAGDVLKMNQAGTSTNSLAKVTTGTQTSAQRLMVISYYLDNTPSPPRLMRQISGHSPMPVAENIVYMKFSYDMYNDNTGSPAINQCNPGDNTTACNLLNGSTGSAGLWYNQITKINILHMALDSTVKGAQGGYQGLDLETSVSARNLTYNDNYNNN